MPAAADEARTPASEDKHPAGIDAVAAPSPSPPSNAHDEHHDGNAKETIESILVAFILAFIFRAFVVEAFVIPTGSMAPTLLGAHMRFECVDCTYRWTVNYSGVSVPNSDDVQIPRNADRRVFGLVCPNCGLQVPETDTRNSANDAKEPPVFYGDRILVLKYAYLLREPERWDVVVFKSPARAEAGMPMYATNFIKRLVGRPYESVMILDGDIYVSRRAPGENTESDYERIEQELTSFEIQRKDPVAQSILWRIVYDNDFLPDRPNWKNPWTLEDDSSGWRLSTNAGKQAREFVFDDSAGRGWIRFDPRAPEKRTTHPLTDWLAYDITREQQGGPRPLPRPVNGLVKTNDLDDYNPQPDNAVGDLKIVCTYSRTAGDGPLRLELGKLDDVFTAEVLPGRVRLLHRRAGEDEEEIDSAPADLGAGVAARLEFQNVDYRVVLRLNGETKLDKAYQPDIPRLLDGFRSGRRVALPLPTVRVSAERQTARLSHLSLWRDIYYTNDSRFPPGWGRPNKIIHLGADEYFVLGDNSLISGDARTWDHEIDLPEERLRADPGRVPGRFLLGKAFFVYWPAGYRPFDAAPGIVPNFGEMRFIH